MVLAKGVSAQDGDAIQAENLPGISLTASYARSYPDGDSTADVLGFTGTSATGDLTGAAGIEEEYNALLAGHAGSEHVQISNNGQPIPLAGSDDQPVVNGSDLRLTIVPSLQYAAEQACAAAGRQEQREQLHGGHHPAQDRPRAGHGAVAHL